MSEFLTIVRAVYSGLSRRKVAAMHKVSRNTVSLYLRQARDQGWLTLEDLIMDPENRTKNRGEVKL